MPMYRAMRPSTHTSLARSDTGASSDPMRTTFGLYTFPCTQVHTFGRCAFPCTPTYTYGLWSHLFLPQRTHLVCTHSSVPQPTLAVELMYFDYLFRARDFGIINMIEGLTRSAASLYTPCVQAVKGWERAHQVMLRFTVQAGNMGAASSSRHASRDGHY